MNCSIRTSRQVRLLVIEAAGIDGDIARGKTPNDLWMELSAQALVKPLMAHVRPGTSSLELQGFNRSLGAIVGYQQSGRSP